jgi:hypothetical protein
LTGEFGRDAVCLGIREAARAAAMVVYSLAQWSLGCCLWAERPGSWLEALGLLAEEAGLSYRGLLEDLARGACGLGVHLLLQQAVARLGLWAG